MSQVPEVRHVNEVFTRLRPVDPDTNFFEAGFTSYMLVAVLEGLREIGLEFVLVDLYRFPTIHALIAEARRRAAPAGSAPGTRLPWSTVEPIG